ncbi:MAG: hypothetical protein ABIG80_00315 [Patescibacteria group bacterium]
MGFLKRNIGHQFRGIYSNNPLLGSNFVCFKLDEDVESSRAALRRDLEALQIRLESEQVLEERWKLEEEIEKIQEQLKTLEVVSAPLNTFLLNGLQNNIDDIDTALESEKDIKKREALEAKRLNCINALSTRQAPVTSIDELNYAVDQIESDQRLLDALEKGKLDEVDLHLFLNSGMMPFVDHRFEGAINIAFGQMFTNDNVQSALGRTSEHVFEEADQKWLEHKANVEKGIQELEEEKAAINSQIKNASVAERERYRRRLKEIDGTINKFREQIESARAEWTHRQRTIEEAAAASRSVLESVQPETLDRLEQLLTEAQSIRAERAQDYLAEEMNKLEQQLEKVKKDGVFSDKTIESIENGLMEARSIIVGQRINDPKKLRRIADNFRSARTSLAASKAEVKKAKENRPQLETEATSDFKRFQALLANFTPEKIRKITQEYRAQLKAEKLPKDEAIYNKALNALTQLSDPQSPLHAQMKEFARRLENISEMDIEEVMAIQQDLAAFRPKLEFLENLDGNLDEALSVENADAKLAHKTIKELERAQNPDDIRLILETNLAGHLNFVSHSDFEKDYRQFTKKGHMVFQEEGGQWKIIIDESVFKVERNLEVLKKQLTHELLHLEFEKSSRVRQQVHQTLIEKDPKKWKHIREAFIAMAKEKKKQPPHGDQWEDEDILSELYAMQNEMGRTWSKGKSSTDKLNNLLTGMGAAAAIGDIAEKTRGYEAGAKETAEDIKKRGYEEGVEEGGRPEDTGKLAITQALSRETAAYEGNKVKINSLRERLQTLGKYEYIGNVSGAGELVNAMIDYNDGTDSLNEDLKNDPESGILDVAITSRINKVSKDLTDVEDKVGKAARKAPNTEISLLRKLWINTTFLSIHDFVQAGTDVYEFLQRRHKRKTADHAARLGMALFSGTDLGREARARQQKAESEEVNEWKSRYENMDAWQLMDEIRGIANSLLPNQDQLKAILRILADKGRINWRNENIWKALNKLQSTAVLKPGDQLLLHNPVLLRQRLRTAMGEIYDYDEFDTLERTNEGNYKSSKSKYDTLHSRMQDKLTDRLDELLSQHRAGEQVDPILYESIMEYCILKGKSYAENIMFHLIAGMATGLLAPDRGLALGDHLNAWPAIDWFTSLQPPMSQEDFRRMAMQYFPSDYMRGSIDASGFGSEFKNFYWTTVQNDEKVVQRVKKSVSERSWDHDWCRSMACMGDADTAKRFLSGRSGQQETKVTAVGNAYVGAVQWLEENSINPRFAKKGNFARIAGWITMSEGMLDGSAYRESSKDITTRANEAMNQDIPRESGVGRHNGVSLGQHRNIVKAFLLAIDPKFFGMITGREAMSKEVKAEMGTGARDYLMQRYPGLAPRLADVENIDQIYDRIDLIIGTIFDQMSDAQFRAILASIAGTVPR